jgi:predicted negative regulator of RcsB-dependent stress response
MAKRHPGSRRVKSHGYDNDPDDLFVARVLHLGKWAQSNQQLLTILAIVGAIIIAGLLYYRNYRLVHAQQAAQQLEMVYQSLTIQDEQGAKDQLVTFLERFSGTPYVGEARLLLGELYLADGQSQQAQAVLAPLGSSPREPIELQGATLLAAAYEEEERWSDAERIYLEIADRSELDFQVRDALSAAARIRASQGNAQGAIELYQRVLSGLEENAPERGQYEMRIQEIRSGAST